MENLFLQNVGKKMVLFSGMIDFYLDSNISTLKFPIPS
jgi:hypothetical protein